MVPNFLKGLIGVRSIIVLLTFQFVIAYCSTLSAQNLSEYNWMFGNSDAHLTFNKSDARAQLDNNMAFPYGTGGGVTISDPVTGDLLFYTDGQNVYDANHDLLPSLGAGLNGDPTINRAAVVYPMPYSNGLYYVFTNSGSAGVNEIQYSVIDKNLAGNATGAQPVLGDLLSLNQSTGLTDPSDAMILIRQDIDNYWLVSQNRTTQELRVTAINSGVVGATQNYDLWTVEVPGFVASDFAFSQANGTLAVAPQESNRNVTLFDFDVSTGILQLDSAILNTGNADFATEAIYGVEWSLSGNQLYISRHGSSGTTANLYQWDVNDSLSTVNSVLNQPIFRSYGLQRGPNGSIYHLYRFNNTGPFEIGVVEEADSTYHADSVQFNVSYNALPFGATGINATQFPEFAGEHFEMFDVLDFFVLDSCAGSTSKFFSSVEPTPEAYIWSFGDGSGSNAVSPVHTYADPGTVTVTLTVVLNGDSAQVSRPMTVVANDLMVDLGNDTTRCVGESFTLDAGAGGIFYHWNTGEGTQTIEADTTFLYTVAVMSAAGCMSYDYIQVTTYEDNREYRNQWYFGEGAGIDFNEPVSAIEDNNLMSSPQAASSVSDLNGELRFYTDGMTIWNKDHMIMQNGDAIGGDNSSMQGVMIVPLPGDSSIYYVFTSDPVWGDYTYDMKYSIVDMRYDSARGLVVQKDLSFMSNSSERMTAYGLGNRTSWLITHEFGNNQFRSYPITQDGIGEPITSAAGTVLRFNEEKTGTAEMQVAQSGRMLAMAIQDTNENYVELFELNDTTGYITQLAKIDINEPAPALIYGLEFSSALTKLYVSTNSNGSKLLQYDLDSLYANTAETDIAATKFEVNTSALSYGALATGSNGVVYLAIDNQGSLGTITSPNSDDNDVSFQEDGFDLISRTSRLGLPNFVQTIPTSSLVPGIQFENPCLGQPTVFEGTGTSNIDDFFWTFGDGTFAAGEDTVKLYGQEGSYNVSLQITNRCGLDTTFLDVVTVSAIPVRPTVQDAVTLCNGPVTLEAWPVDTAAFTYTWSTGQTSRQITVNSASFVEVYITDTTGCRSNPSFSFVDDTSPVVSLGPDRIVCQNQVVSDLDAQNPGSAYTWRVNGVSNGNTLSLQPIDTSVPGVFVYYVEVEDIFSCVTEDSVRITVEAAPDANYAAIPTTGCGLADGQIQIDVVDSGSFTYSLTGPVNVPTTAITGPNTVTVGSLSAGAYLVSVRNILTGCTNDQTVTVSDGGAGFFIDDVSGIPGCQGAGELVITMSLAVPTNVDYELYNSSGALVIAASATVVANQFSITSLDSGQYSLTVQEVGGANCIQTVNNIILNGLPVADYTVVPQYYCDEQGQIGISPVTIDANIIYTWTGPSPGDIVGSAVGDSIVVASPGSYTVVSSGTGFCSLAQSVLVNQNPSPDLSIGIEGQECDGRVTLSANVTNPVGNLAFQWENGLGSAQRIVTEAANYSVTVLDQGSGCTAFTALDVFVYDELTVSIVADPNCDDNSEVYLNAYANITEDVTFTWTAPDGETLPEAGAVVSVGESGLYTVNVVSDLTGCEATANINAMVLPIDEAQLLLEARESFCSLDPASNSLTLDPGNFASYEWSLVNTNDVLSNERNFIVSEQGVYEVRLTNGFTCVTDVIEVLDNCAPLVYAPTAFTPNNDNINDEFFVYQNPYVTNFKVKIFSRWGEQVFEANSLDFSWNGVFNGAILPNGTYVYIMTYESALEPERGTVVQRGGVVLLR